MLNLNESLDLFTGQTIKRLHHDAELDLLTLETEHGERLWVAIGRHARPGPVESRGKGDLDNLKLALGYWIPGPLKYK